MSLAEHENPYATPRPEVAIDFREAAVEDSIRLLADSGGGRTIEDLGVSLVVPVGPEGVRRLRWIGRMVLLRLVSGIGGLALGALLASAQENLTKQWNVPEALSLSVAATCSLGGICVLLLNPYFMRRAARRALGERYESVQRLSTGRKPLCTGVENAETFKKMKIVPEDLAWIAFDPPGRRLILEGVLFRYVVHAADVLFVGQVAGATTTGIQITFRVGRVAFAVTLQFDSVWHEFKKQTIGVSEDPLLKPIVAVFRGFRKARSLHA
jgi:hypothetical protein